MTAQIPDRIVVDGAEGALLVTPLDAFLVHLPGRPPLVAPHTANDRGYVARWRVTDDRLYLDDVRGWIDHGREAPASTVLPDVQLPFFASWVHGQLRIGLGAVVRYVHAGFEHRYEQELLLDLEGGVVRRRRKLAATGAMGMAGPYRLEEPLLGFTSGGGFGQLIAALDVDGQPLVAKAARPSGGAGGTEVWSGDRPVHVPARAFVERGGQAIPSGVGGDVTAAVLRAEVEVLEHDGGRLLPRSLGIWEHDTSGSPVLVMELLHGHPPRSAYDVRAVLAAVSEAVRRGTFEAHGDLKLEHAFIDADGGVRICDPAPRFEQPAWRAYTPAYNPAGWFGPAADVVACASMLRYLPDGPQEAWPWADEVLTSSAPPSWAVDHERALARLDEVLASPAATSFSLPSGTEWGPSPSAGRPAMRATASPSGEADASESERAVRASVDRIVVAGMDVLLGSNLADHPDVMPPPPDLVDLDATSVEVALASIGTPPGTHGGLYGADAQRRAVARLAEWGSHALAAMAGRTGYDPRAVGLDLPGVVRRDVVERVLDHAARAHVEHARATGGAAGGEPWGSQAWWYLVEHRVATTADLAWAAAVLTADLARKRREEYDDARGGLAMVLDELDAQLVGGLLVWNHHAGAVVGRPLRYELRTLFDPGSDAMIWQASRSALDRWDYWIDHFDLPIPTRLAARVQRLVVRYDLAHPDVGNDHVPFGPGEGDQFERDYDAVCDDLDHALGSAYTIGTRMRP